MNTSDIVFVMVVAGILSLIGVVAVLQLTPDDSREAIVDCEPGPAYKLMPARYFIEFERSHHIYDITGVGGTSTHNLLVHYEEMCD